MVHLASALTFLFVASVEARRNLKGGKDGHKKKYPVQLGPRPYYLVNSMKEGDLKDKLMQCAAEKTEFKPSDWSISHRGSTMMVSFKESYICHDHITFIIALAKHSRFSVLQYPEHTLLGYEAALIMGAGVVECDVTFTKDKQLVCRHAQCDLHTTTDVVLRPEMNAKCTTPYTPGGSPKCCASDFTLAEIKTLCAKMDAADYSAETAEGFVGGVASFRTTMYSYECPEVPTHMESIELIKSYGAKFTPELKTPEVEMPYQGTYSQEDFAQQLIDEYIEAGVDPDDVFQQSFLWSDTIYW